MEQSNEQWWQAGFVGSSQGDVQLIDERVKTGPPEPYLKISPSAMEGLLSEPTEIPSSQEQKMGELLRRTYGILAHDFFALSGAAVLWRKDSERNPQEHLARIFRTWSSHDLLRAGNLLSQLKSLGRETLNQHDYLLLLKLTVEEAERRGPFTDTLPLEILNGSISPRDFDQKWEELGMGEKLEEFARACQRFHQESKIFKPWNRDNVSLETGCLLIIDYLGVRLNVPLRMDLLHYPDPTDQLGKPDIYDLKTMVEFPGYPPIGGKRTSISPLLYRLTADQLPLNVWGEGKREAPKVYLSDQVVRLTHDLPPLYILSYRPEKGGIISSFLKPPARWEGKLFGQLEKVQEILEEKREQSSPADA